ncbi:hypothetical protein GQ600_12320 [Phytophthora cactorum]|nr:hypothetical protein GQ600_12320 [Phytophthora cactorum]
MIEEENVLRIKLSAPFRWTGSPRFYEIFGGAISHVNAVSPTVFATIIGQTTTSMWLQISVLRTTTWITPCVLQWLPFWALTPGRHVSAFSGSKSTPSTKWSQWLRPKVSCRFRLLFDVSN